VPNSLVVNNFKARQVTVVFFDIEFARPMNHVVEALDRDLNDVILGVIDDSD
jgi:hypothetical protein